MSRKKRDAQNRAIANVIAVAPGLGAFAVAVGQLDLQGAVDLCATRDPSPSLQAAWDDVGYTVEQLPSAEDIRCLLLGIEARRRNYVHKRATKTAAPVPLFVMAKAMGCSAQDIQRGLVVLSGYLGNAFGDDVYDSDPVLSMGVTSIRLSAFL